MSYGTKYRLTYTDYFDQASELLIQKNGYSGAVTDIKLTGNPITITYDTPSDFKLDPINGSSMTMRLVAETDFQFEDLYTSSNREYQIIFNLAGSVHWKGFIQPEQYQGQYAVAPYVISFLAVDQLGFLKTLVWDRTSVELEITTLGAILAKTNLDINLYEALNIYEEHYDDATSDSPLAQTYINTKVFADKTYYDALCAILLKYAAIIKQDRGKWFIYRPEDTTASYQRRLWTYSAGVFTYNSTAVYNPIVSTTSAKVAKATLVRIANNSTRRTDPAWQKYQLKQNYGMENGIVRNSDFTLWTKDGLRPTYWSLIDTTVSRVGDKMSLAVGNSFDGSKYVSQSFSIQGSYEQKFRIKFSYDVFCPADKTCAFQFALKLLSGGGYTYYFNFDTLSWDQASVKYSKTHGSTSSVSTTENVEIIGSALGVLFDPDNTITVLIYRANSNSTNSYIYVNEMDFEFVNYIGSVAITEPEAEVIDPIIINPANNFDGGEHELLLSDVPAIANTRSIYKGGLWLDSTQLSPTGKWTSPQGTNSLAELLKFSISNLYLNPSEILSVIMYSKLLFSSSVIQEINNSNKLYLIKRATWEALSGKWNLEAYKIGQADVPVEAILAEDGTDLLNEDGTQLIIE